MGGLGCVVPVIAFLLQGCPPCLRSCTPGVIASLCDLVQVGPIIDLCWTQHLVECSVHLWIIHGFLLLLHVMFWPHNQNVIIAAVAVLVLVLDQQADKCLQKVRFPFLSRI